MSFLDRITASRLADAQRRSESGALDAARAAAGDAPAARDFVAAISTPELALIAEIKRASPARGAIALEADAASVAKVYQDGGASAISVLTEPEHFKGSLKDLSDARSAVAIPVLRKDFVMHPLQIWEARAAGADAVLLIVAATGRQTLASLIECASEAGLAADVEVHDPGEVSIALDAGARIIAINSRDLKTLEVDLGAIERLRPLVPRGIPVIAESGIAGRADVERMAAADVDAIHVGEALMRAADPALEIARLLGRA